MQLQVSTLEGLFDVTARAESTPSPRSSVVSGRAEHISIEADPETVEALLNPPPRRRKVRSRYVLNSRLRGCQTELSILEEHYLSVRSIRPHAQPREYELDLRFANPKPVRVRHISWFWLAIATGLAALGSGAVWSMRADGQLQWLSPLFLAAVLTLIAACGAAFMFLRRTIESLEFLSAHGGATLISVTGGIGSARTGKHFFIELIKNINAAKAVRPQPRQQLLRDEMREHHRLRELGVITEQQYEQSKARILASH